MASLDWLTAQPVAHRGLHDPARGLLENTPSAIAAAADRGFAIEIDVHLSADGQVYTFHDFMLDRLTTGTGSTAGLSLAALQAIAFRDTADRIPSLAEVLEIVGERTPLVIEVKSDRKGRKAELVSAVAHTLAAYQGPVAVMSFDPTVVEDFAAVAPQITRGIVADDAADDRYYGDLSAEARAEMASLSHLPRSKAQFVAYWVKLLPNAVSRRVREELKLPLLTWTVRTPEERATALAHADQMIFEGFDPAA